MNSISEFGINSFNAGTTALPEPGRRLLTVVAGQTAPQVHPTAAMVILHAYRMFLSQPPPQGMSANDWQLSAVGAVCAGNWPSLGEPTDIEAQHRVLVLLAMLKMHNCAIPHP